MIKDFELIAGCKLKDINSKFEMNQQLAINNVISLIENKNLMFEWSYDAKSNRVSMKAGNFNCSFVVDEFAFYRIAKNIKSNISVFRELEKKHKTKPLTLSSVKIKKVIKKAVNVRTESIIEGPKETSNKFTAKRIKKSVATW